ncbi:uncharacterized protein LOC129797296 [Lutzomyia longipalpis]|uniref:uncharacterized protein LOC129797296 n=1 Tax=Lutzomyia longipalpis TaxID=7200 RepID=UPI00248360E6|nr:uncharacterized protein LOC129797296 [Lutzomyia longipalpis]
MWIMSLYGNIMYPDDSTNPESAKEKRAILGYPYGIPTSGAWTNPWTYAAHPSLMEFKGTPLVPSSVKSQKRRSDIEPTVPAKKLLTEEKMAAHLNNLHISSDFTSHSSSNDFEVESEMQLENEQPSQYFVNMTQWDLEQKLRNAQRITVCDEVKNLGMTDSILPKVLLDKMENPCTALVLWQPPTILQKLIVPQKDLPPEQATDDEEEVDNNNSSAVDLNNFAMETDI